MSFELTDEEHALLDRYLDFYEALASGERPPDAEAQQHFLKVARGKAGAETPHELAYAKLMRQRAQDMETQRQTISERRESQPPPEWFSREDHGKLRRRQFADWMSRRGGS